MRKAFIPPVKLLAVFFLSTIVFNSCAKPKEGCKSCTVYQSGSSFTVENCSDDPVGALKSDYPDAEITCH